MSMPSRTLFLMVTITAALLAAPRGAAAGTGTGPTSPTVTTTVSITIPPLAGTAVAYDARRATSGNGVPIALSFFSATRDVVIQRMHAGRAPDDMTKEGEGQGGWWTIHDAVETSEVTYEIWHL